METLWVIIAYLVGSVPFGLVLARAVCGIDPRTDGSGNVGATNVARLCGTPLGAATLACDVLKGALPVWAALAFDGGAVFVTCVALAAVLGHRYSCFLWFRGGKAVATSVGVFLPIAFWQLLVAGVLCIYVIWRSNFVSLGSLCLAGAMPVLLLFTGCWEYLPLALILMGIIAWSHRENIQRLLLGVEKPWRKQ